MVGLIVLVICMGGVFIIMEWRVRSLKRELYTFESRLETYLEDLVSGNDIAESEDNMDTLWSKIYERLQRLQQIWKSKDVVNLKEKKKIQALISDISHQTKTPISNMKIYLELLSNETQLSEKGQEFLHKIERQTEKLEFLLQSMVKMSRLETGIIKIRQQKDCLSETLGGAVSAVIPMAQKKYIKIYVDCDEKIVVSHDKKWSEEAIFNILDNAVKYTDPGGNIHIRVLVQEIFTKMSIKDSGKGIALERQAEIFTRFYREPEVHKVEGIGVGLYLAREILTMQKGYIMVQSDGRGADFQLYFLND